MGTDQTGPPRLAREADRASAAVKGRQFDIMLVEGGAWRIPSPREDPFSAWDTETTYIVYDGSELQGVTLQVCYLKSRVVHVVPWYDWEAYKRDFAAARPGTEVVMHNAAFDLKVLGFQTDLWLWGAFWDGLVTDTMVRTLHRCQQRGKYMPRLSLKDCARVILRLDLSKDEAVRFSHARDMVYTRQHLEYGAKDAIVTALLRETLGGPMKDRGPECELVALKGAVALEAVRDNGMLVDQAEYSRMRRRIYDNAQHHADFLREWGVSPGVEGNAKELQRVLAKFEERYGFTLPRTEKSGDRQLNDLVMSNLAPEQRHPFMASYCCYIGARQILSHFFHDVLDGSAAGFGDEDKKDDARRVHADGCLHPRYAWATDTGRTQCSGPNAQNFPRKCELWWDAMKEKPDETLSVRGYVIPRAGMAFNSIDFNQLELCGLAEDCMVRFGKSVMAELINSGVDLHTWFAEQISLARKTDWKSLNKKQRKNMRALAKVANFGEKCK